MGFLESPEWPVRQPGVWRGQVQQIESEPWSQGLYISPQAALQGVCLQYKVWCLPGGFSSRPDTKPEGEGRHGGRISNILELSWKNPLLDHHTPNQK